MVFIIREYNERDTKKDCRRFRQAEHPLLHWQAQIENDGLMDRYLYTGTHEAVISDEMFLAVQREKLNRSTQSGGDQMTGLRCELGEPPFHYLPAKAAT